MALHPQMITGAHAVKIFTAHKAKLKTHFCKVEKQTTQNKNKILSRRYLPLRDMHRAITRLRRATYSPILSTFP